MTAVDTTFRLVFKRHSNKGAMVPEAYLDVKQWGNNLGVRLPVAVARAARLRANQRVRITVVDHSIVITPVESKPLTLDERLALFEPSRHGGESMATERVGAERW